MMFDPAPFLKKLDRCAVMGIVNITGDSFSEGPASAPESAERRAFALFEAGADILDLGAESTRPGSREVKPDEECARLLPVLNCLRAALPEVVISIDTRHGETARRALEAGADIINDVSMGSDHSLLEAAARNHAALVLCHARGTPDTMQSPKYTSYPAGVRATVTAELESARDRAVSAGVAPEKIIFDPGIGFAKTAEQCRTLIAEAALFDPRYLWLWGISRKSFMGGDVSSRGPETLRLECRLAAAGAAVIRTHDVRALTAALKHRER